MNKFKFWFNNARPIALPQSLLPAIAAIALSYGSQDFSWIAALACFFGVMSAHLGMNLFDDWFDYRVDSAKVRKEVGHSGFRGRMVKYPYLESGEATHKQLLVVASLFLAFAGAMGVIVFIIRGLNVAWWALAGLVIGLSYSGGPLKLGFRGLGELVIFTMFGPLMMTGIHYAVTGVVSPKIIWLSVSVGLLVTNIVYSHSILDAVPDKKMGKTTMAHLMGSDKGMIVLSVLINILPYVLVSVAVVLGDLHWAYLSVFAILPLSIWLVGSLNDFVNHREVQEEPKKWMGPMGDFEKYKKAGLAWFMLRWLTARNIVTFFCIIICIVNFIVG